MSSPASNRVRSFSVILTPLSVMKVVANTTLPQSYCSNYGILAETMFALVSVCARACEMEIRGTCWVIWRGWRWRRRIHCGNYSNCLCAENSCWEIRLNTCGKHTNTQRSHTNTLQPQRFSHSRSKSFIHNPCIWPKWNWVRVGCRGWFPGCCYAVAKMFRLVVRALLVGC